MEDMGSLYFEIEKYYKGKFLVDALESSITIRELNILARKVAEMDKGQEAVFEGLTKMELKNQPVSHRSYQKLLQMAENTDCYHRVPQARNDGQLGRFYAENGFVEGVDKLSDKLFELLDVEQIGRKMRLAEGGVFTGGGYVMQHEELRELEKLPDLGFRRPYYTLLLEISQAAYENGPVLQLELPMTKEHIQSLAEKYPLEDEIIRCTDCAIPFFRNYIGERAVSLQELNEFAQMMNFALERGELAKYKAILLATGCRDVSQVAVSSGDGGTTVSITDITPRDVVDEGKTENKADNTQEKSHEAKSYTVSSYYPVSVQTAEEDGVRLLVKTFLVPENTAPQGLIKESLTRRGIAYKVTDILQQKLSGEVETKAVSQSVTLESETDKTEDILPLLKSSMDYRENGFSGTLALDRGSIQAKAAGNSSYAYTLKEEKEFSNLDRNDLAYIPKTTEKNGITLSLVDVEWTPMASGAENSEVPSLFSALATYTGTAWGSKADGYTVTTDYTREVSRVAEGQVLYSIVYEEVMPEGRVFPWQTIGLIVLFVGLGAGIGTGVFFLVRALRNRERKPKVSKDPYAGRPKMHRPEMLRAMDRGLGED